MRFPKVMHYINLAGAFICGSIVLVASALAVVESLLRKVFLNPTSWSLNITQGVFIWAAFLGSSWAFQELGHVSVDSLRNAVDKRSKSVKRWPRRVISIIGYLLSFAVIAFLLWGGYLRLLNDIQYNRLATYNIYFPMAISDAATVVGSVQMLFTLIFIILDLFSGNDKYL